MSKLLHRILFLLRTDKVVPELLDAASPPPYFLIIVGRLKAGQAPKTITAVASVPKKQRCGDKL